MDNEIFSFNENGYFLIMNTDDNESWFIEMIDYNQNILFHHICDTFVTGDLILHLQKGIKQFIKSKYHKICLSRWYPHVSPLYFINTGNNFYISICIYRDSKNNEDFFKFIVHLDGGKEEKFKIPFKEIKNKIYQNSRV